MKTIARNGLCTLLLLLTGIGMLRAQPAPVAIIPPTNAPATASAATNCLGPRIEFATREPNFGRARKGDVVRYTYNFTNTGDQVLHVSNVAPGCGCTRAGDWTREVAPGKSGIIPIQLNTDHFQGDVVKMITVNCDDKSNAVVQLLLKGNIWTPIEVNPTFVNFTVVPEVSGGSGTAVITNNTEEPLYLSDPQSTHPGFAVEVKTNTPGRSYQVQISRVPPLTPGVTSAQITLKTSWTNPPTLSLTAYANVQPPIMVQPSPLTIAQAPLANPTSITLTIQNNTTNRMALSEPVVSGIKDVKVELKEASAGRYFNASLTFPAGLEILPSQHAEFTVKTGLTNQPVITVPIVQPPRPVRPTPVAAPQPGAAPRVLPMPAPPRADAR